MIVENRVSRAIREFQRTRTPLTSHKSPVRLAGCDHDRQVSMKRTLMTTAVVLGAWISIGNVAWSAPLPLIVAHPPLCTSAAPVVFVKGGSYSPKLAIHTSPGASEKWDWATGGIAESVTSTDF